MSLIPEVKCRRCGERFSSLRSRCPNCGTRRVSQSSRTPSATPGTVNGTASYTRANTNTRWQMMFGLILVVAVILAVIVMVSTGLNGTDVSSRKTTPTPNTSLAPTEPTPEPPPTPTPTPRPTLESLKIAYNDNPLEDFTFQSAGEKVTLTAKIAPATIADKVTWTTSDANEEFFFLTIDPDDGNKCTVECLKRSSTPQTITAELYGQTVSCTVYFGNGVGG